MNNTTPTLNSIKTTNEISMSVTDVYLKTSDKIKIKIKAVLRIRIRWIRKIFNSWIRIRKNMRIHTILLLKSKSDLLKKER